MASPKTTFEIDDDDDIFEEDGETENKLAEEREAEKEAERLRHIAKARAHNAKRRAQIAAAAKRAEEEEAKERESATRVKFAVPPVSSYDCPRPSTSAGGAACASTSHSVGAQGATRAVVSSRPPPPLPQRPAVHKQPAHDEMYKLPPSVHLLAPNFFSALKGSRIDFFNSPGLTRSVSITLPHADVDFEEGEEVYKNMQKAATLQRTPSKMKKALALSTPDGLDQGRCLRSGKKC